MASLGYDPVPLTAPIMGDKRPGVKIFVNDTPATVLVDSGANATRISSTFAREANVRILPGRRATSRGALGRAVSVSRGVGKLDLGPLSLEPYTFSVADLGGAPTAAGRFPGHIGAESIRITASLIDVSGNTLWVPTEKAVTFRGNGFTGLGRQSGLGVVALPLERATSYFHVLLRGEIDGRRVSFIIDTGAEVSIITTEAARRLGLPVRQTNSTMLDAHGDRTRLGRTLVPAIQFGGFLARQVPLAVADIPAFESSGLRTLSGNVVDGILGIEFLRQTGALIDPRSELIYFGNP